MRRLRRCFQWILFGALLVSVDYGLAQEFPAPGPGLRPISLPDLTLLEDAVQQQLRSVEASLRTAMANPETSQRELSDAFGLAGRHYHAYEFWSAAESCYWNASKLNPQNFAWIYLLARVYHSQGRPDEALSWYLKAGELRQDYSALPVNLGNVYLDKNDLDSAESAFKTAFSLGENQAASDFGLGRVAISRKAYKEAIDHFLAALQRVPEATRLHYSLGIAYRELGDLDQARSHLQKKGPIGVRPADPLVDQLEELKQGERVHLLRGRLAYNAGDYEMAAAEFQKAAEADRESARAMVNLGTALARVGRTDEALGSFREALQLDPDSSTARFNLGSLLASQGKFEEAIVHLRAAVASDPEDSLPHWELAEALAKLEMWEKALAQYLKVAELHPSREEPVLESLKMMLHLARFREALNRLEEAHAQMPQQGRITHALARVLAACPDATLRDGERALELALQVYEARSTVVHAETVAFALAESGRCEEASEWQRRAIEAAAAADRTDLMERFRISLVSYEAGPPCRPPM